MNSDHLRHLVAGKRHAMEPLSDVARAQGFLGWHASSRLPHFDRPGVLQFVTYRLADALPAVKLREWRQRRDFESDAVLRWRMEAWLDRGLGACHLRDSRVAEMIQENLWYYDGEHYRLHAWVVMANHVHVLFEPWDVPMWRTIQRWKSYTAKQANRILGRSGRFWEDDYFDRYVRHERHYRRLVRYTEGNPQKAQLVREAGDWRWSSAAFRGEAGTIVPVLSHPTAKRGPPAFR